MTLGSLFDGIGGFPLSGVMHGIRPVWAAEIEPFPVLVTSQRFPKMKHLGSVTDISGAEIEPVDIITFGSPCQDLSVAGLQKGIHEGARSSLFFEAVRIIKEMRAHERSTGRSGKHVRPRFAVWENVPGAFSSNKGRDFQAVLQALCEVADPGASVPFPEKGKWSKAGYIVGDGYSIAWRTYDAQYWGVLQRRKRIYLVADFAGERAGEILFEQDGVRGHSEEGGEERQGTATDAEGCAGRGCYAFPPAARPGGSVSPCIGGQHQATVGVFIGEQGAKAGGIGYSEDVSPTIKSVLSGSNTVPDVAYAVNAKQQSLNVAENHGNTLGANDYKEPQVVVYPAVARTLTAEHDASPCIDRGQNVVAFDCRNMMGNDEIRATIQAKNQGGYSLNYINPVVFALQGNGIDRADTAGCNGCGWREGASYTLNTIDRHGVVYEEQDGCL